MTMAQLWGGRFTKQTDQLVFDFNASITFDKRLFAINHITNDTLMQYSEFHHFRVVKTLFSFKFIL